MLTWVKGGCMVYGVGVGCSSCSGSQSSHGEPRLWQGVDASWLQMLKVCVLQVGPGGAGREGGCLGRKSVHVATTLQMGVLCTLLLLFRFRVSSALPLLLWVAPGALTALHFRVPVCRT